VRRLAPILLLVACAGSALPPTVPLGPGRALLRRDGQVLHIAMEVGNRGIGSVLVQSSDRLWVLHASAALGTGVYRRDGEAWRRVQDFDYQCRDNGDTACRDAFRAREGWIANVAARTGADRRFELDLPRFGPSPRIAVTYLILEPESAVGWPANLDDDAVSLPVQEGRLPETIRVRLDRWAEVPL
jgi:hypothetical protein